VDFSHEELLETVERLVNGLLERAGAAEPPVDALHLAEEHLGIPVEVVEPAETDESGRRRPSPRRHGAGITLSPDMTAAQRQKAAADGIARSLLPDVLRRLGLPPGSENRQFATAVRGLLVPRLLIPTRQLRTALKSCKYDVPALQQLFSTATTEAVGLRLLDLDEPCVVSIVDDGVVAIRRGNRFAVGRKLEPAEQQCHDRVAELESPHRVRRAGWTVDGWFVPDRPFRRILLRATRDDDV
jgi:predicted transcriptional regulator